MRRFGVCLALWFLPVLVAAQATHVSTSGTLPATCRVGDVYYKTGTSAGLYNCTASNTWTVVASGTGVLPGANGGGLVLLEQHAASSSATLDFTTCLSSTYDEYQLDFLGIIPATNGVNLLLRMSTDGGSTYDSGTNYSWNGWRFNAAGGSFDGAASGATSIDLTGQRNTDSINNSSTTGFSGTYTLSNPGSTSLYKQTYGVATFLNNSASTPQGVTATGRYLSTTAVNAFRVLMSTGNISSGTGRCYGLAK